MATLSAALLTALSWPAGDALALAMGRITVQSGLGEPLRAEVELTNATAKEMASLETWIGEIEAFRNGGREYNPILDSLRITKYRYPNGRAVLRLSSDRAVKDPFVDLVLNVRWSAGHLVRDYTVLLDPRPRQRAVAPVQTTAPQLSPSPQAAAPTPAPQAPAAAASAAGGQVTVRAGDTAGQIAQANKAPSVSLDQMLVAMLRANPDAFVQGNVNRLKAGTVLGLPTTAQAAAIPEAEASQTIIAQSQDFNAFRTRLAEAVPTVPTDTPERGASGRVQAQVDERRPAATAPDKLTLSKGGVQTGASEEQIARQRASSDSAERVAELSRNISELNQLGVAGGASEANGYAQAIAPAQAPAAAPAPAAAEPVGPATPPSASAAPAATSPATPMVPSAPTPAGSGVAKPAALPPPAPDSWLDGLRANPLLLAAAAALILLLGLFGWQRHRQNKQAEADNADLDNRQQPDSFFGASGGQRLDTAEGELAASTMSYAPSQLDTAGDVDPVAEADVYLAYGRDQQAEEILKEALRVAPTRVAIHAKLAEIHAKRRDAMAFASVAQQVHTLTGGAGPEWAHVAELSRGLDTAHPLWSDALVATLAAPATAPASESPSAERDLPALDLNLDLDLPDDPTSAAPQPPAAPLLPELTSAPAQAPAAALQPADRDVDLGLGSLTLDLADSVPAGAANAAAGGASGDDPLATKLALAEEFNVIGDADGARALAEEVLAEGSGPLRARAERFLAELA